MTDGLYETTTPTVMMLIASREHFMQGTALSNVDVGVVYPGKVLALERIQ